MTVEEGKGYRGAEGRQVRFVRWVTDTEVNYRARICGREVTIPRAEMEAWAVEEI